MVASDNPGYASVVTPEQDGLLVPPEDPGALAAMLIRLLIQPDTRARLVAAGHQTAARYDWPLVAARIEDFYFANPGPGGSRTPLHLHHHFSSAVHGSSPTSPTTAPGFPITDVARGSLLVARPDDG